MSWYEVYHWDLRNRFDYLRYKEPWDNQIRGRNCNGNGNSANLALMTDGYGNYKFVCETNMYPIIYPYNSISGTFEYLEDLRSVNLSAFDFSDVENFSRLFYNCYMFNQAFVIPNSAVNCEGMFYNCRNFNSPITIPGDVESCYGMFANCVNFNQPVNIPNGCLYMAGMFNGCTNLNQSFHIQNIDSQTVNFEDDETFSDMFRRCQSLRNITFSNCDFGDTSDDGRNIFTDSYVDNILIEDCTGRLSLDLSRANNIRFVNFSGGIGTVLRYNFDSPYVNIDLQGSDIGYGYDEFIYFSRNSNSVVSLNVDCSELAAWDDDPLIENAHCEVTINCGTLTHIVGSADFALNNCTGNINLTIDSCEEDVHFRYCEFDSVVLRGNFDEAISFPGGNASDISIRGNVDYVGITCNVEEFSFIGEARNIYLSRNVEEFSFTGEASNISTYSGVEIGTAQINGNVNTVVMRHTDDFSFIGSIENGFTLYDSYNANVSIPINCECGILFDNVHRLEYDGPIIYNENSYLQSPNFVNSNIVILGNNVTNCFNLFGNKANMNNLSFVAVTSNNVSNMSKMFYNCRRTNFIAELPNSVNNCDCKMMFHECYNFNTIVNIPNGVINCNRMFLDCYNFNQPITIPSSVISCDGMFLECHTFNQPIIIPDNVNNCNAMFSHCNNFNQSITIPDSVVDCYRMFSGCYNLNQLITIGNNVVNCYGMFSGCYSLNQSVTIGNNVVDFGYMFWNCSNFNQPIVIPEGVLSCSDMFYGCANFNQPIVIPKTVESITEMFAYCFNMHCPIYVPSENFGPVDISAWSANAQDNVIWYN